MNNLLLKILLSLFLIDLFLLLKKIWGQFETKRVGEERTGLEGRKKESTGVAYLFVVIILVPQVNGNKKKPKQKTKQNKTNIPHAQFVVLKMWVSKPLKIHSMASLRLGHAGDFTGTQVIYLRNSKVTPVSRTDRAACLMSLLWHCFLLPKKCWSLTTCLD